MGGFYVGLGGFLSKGCLFGHGLGGVPRLNKSSGIALATIILAGVGTSTLLDQFKIDFL